MEISRPVRVSRTYIQHLVAEPSRVFPLLCPVREAEWIEGWDPVAVWSDSGLAEPDCVFVTAADGQDAIWFVTRHEPTQGLVEMLKVTPGVTACKLSIRLDRDPVGTAASVTYCYTSLGPAGDEFLDAFTEEYYARFMRDWESRLNHYLVTGEMLRGEPIG